MGHCWTFVGVVSDPFGRGTAGVLITTDAPACVGSGSPQAETDDTGTYSLSVGGTMLGVQASVTASKQGYVASTRTLCAGVCLGGTDTSYKLLYALTAALSPAALPSGSVGVAASSLAPPPGGAPAAVVIAQRAGARVALAQGATDSAGYTTWSGFFSVGATDPEGAYSVTVCAVSQGFNGTCDDAAGLGPPAIVSPNLSRTYTVDRTSPVLSSSTPARFTDVLELPAISVTWSDTGSGVDPASLAMSVDGSAVPVTVSGAGATVVATAPGSTVQPGIHLVEVRARDLAGNLGAPSFIFTLAVLSADPANATLQPMTVPVNPSGSLVPPPATVTFRAPTVSTSGFKETVSASTRVGFGAISRPVALGEDQVVFNNETGIPRNVSIPIPVASVTHQLAALSPSGLAMVGFIPPQTALLPDVVVSVPTGYNTPGSTATLQSLSTGLGSPQPEHGTLFGSDVSGSAAVDVVVAACQERHPSSDTAVVCAQDPFPYAQVYLQGRQAMPLVEVGGPSDGLAAIKHPTCSPANGFTQAQGGGCTAINPDVPMTPYDEMHASLYLGCADLGGSGLNLCDGSSQVTSPGGYLGAYVNGWVFKDGLTGAYPLWRQDHADPGADICPNGQVGNVTSLLYRAASNTLALDGATEPHVGGTFKRSTDPATTLQVGLGAVTQAAASSNESSGALQAISPTASYQVQSDLSVRSLGPSEGFYRVSPGTVYDADGRGTATGSGSSNSWHADEADTPVGTQSSAQLSSSALYLMNGDEFSATSPSGGYAFSEHLAAQFVVSFECH